LRSSGAVIRNLEITHCYGRLSRAMTERVGRCANWCTYATWASRRAGRTIRGEDLLETLRNRLMVAPVLLRPWASLGRMLLRRGLLNPHTPLGRMTAQLHTPFDAFERTSDAVARGNRKVFAEIGREFARFLHEVPADAGADSRRCGPSSRASSLTIPLRQGTEGGERLDGCGQVGVGGKTLEVGVVVEDRRIVVLSDRGSEVVQRRNAQVLMRGAELVLQIDGSVLRTFGDPQQWKFAWVDRRKDTTGPRLEHERGARCDEASRDPVGHLAVTRLIELRAAQAPERAGVEQQQASAHGCRLACRIRWASSRSGAGPARSRSANVSRARA